MWLHDDRNQIFSVGMGSSISVGEFSTCCAFLLGPGCLGRGRSHSNAEKTTQSPSSPAPCSTSVKTPKRDVSLCKEMQRYHHYQSINQDNG